MSSPIFFGKNLLIAALSVFFLLFGVETLIGAFNLDNPFEFIMYFFAASLIILISLVGIIYPAFQIRSFFQPRKVDHDV